MSLIEDDRIRGKKVITSDGRTIGEVIGLEIDITDWKVKWIDVKLLRDVLDGLRVKKPLFGTLTVRFSPERMKSVTDNVVLTIDFEQTSNLLHADSESEGVGTKKE